MQLPALAYGFANTFRIKDLAEVFAGATVKHDKGRLMATYAPDSLAVAFGFGALVFVNVSAEERTRVIGTILGRLEDEPHPPLEEDFLIEIRDGAPVHGQVSFDRVTIPALTPAAADIITLLLAQSVSIDYYEEDLQAILVDIDKKTDRMKATGRVPGSARELTRFVASTIDTKNQIIAALAVLDKPAATWEAEPLDRLFRDLRAMLEIDDRFKALEYRMRTIQDTLELFLDLSATKRSLFLEATIVALIVFEIALTLIKEL